MIWRLAPSRPLARSWITPLAKDGSAIAYSVSSKTPASDGAFVRTIADGSTKTLLTGQGTYKGFAFDTKATQLAFISDRDDYASKASRFKLYHAAMSSNSATELNVPAETRAGPTAVSENGRLEFSKDGTRLFFGTAAPPRADPDDAPEPVKVDIWNYKDAEIQPMQKVRADEERKRNFRAMITLADRKFTQLASPDMPEVLTQRQHQRRARCLERPLQAAHLVGRQLRRRLSGVADRRIAEAHSGESELPCVAVAGFALRAVLRRARRQLARDPDERRPEHQPHGEARCEVSERNRRSSRAPIALWQRRLDRRRPERAPLRSLRHLGREARRQRWTQDHRWPPRANHLPLPARRAGAADGGGRRRARPSRHGRRRQCQRPAR